LDPLWLAFLLCAALTWLGVPALAAAARGRRYATFTAVVLSVSLPGLIALHARLHILVPEGAKSWLDLGFAYLMLASGIHLTSLLRARLRGALFRVAFSIPGQAFLAAGPLAGLWLCAWLPIRLGLWALGFEVTLGVLAWLDPVPLAVAAASLVTSLRPSREWVRVGLGGERPEAFARVPVERYRRPPPAPAGRRPLRIVQIADPHLGPWQPTRTLRRRIDELLDRDPDLVLLTGDFLTMEGNATPGALAEAFAPLRRLPGRCFAIFGNHDHEAPDVVRHALESNRVRLLVDGEAEVETPVGPVQIVGADYVGRGRERHIPELLARFPRRDGRLRIFLLHDPAGFQHVPPGDVDLTLSGHTHGGQLGLLSFGLRWTVLSRSRWPDHGLFARGRSLLYVHRGTGFYGFPLRIGVPGEASLLELVPAP
jgi:hypothetical protein